MELAALAAKPNSVKSMVARNAPCLIWVIHVILPSPHVRFTPRDGVIGRRLVDSRRFWVLRFRLMVKRGPWLRPQASEGEAQHGPFCWIGRIGQGDKHLRCG